MKTSVGQLKALQQGYRKVLDSLPASAAVPVIASNSNELFEYAAACINMNHRFIELYEAVKSFEVCAIVDKPLALERIKKAIADLE